MNLSMRLETDNSDGRPLAAAEPPVGRALFSHRIDAAVPAPSVFPAPLLGALGSSSSVQLGNGFVVSRQADKISFSKDRDPGVIFWLNESGQVARLTDGVGGPDVRELAAIQVAGGLLPGASARLRGIGRAEPHEKEIEPEASPHGDLFERVTQQSIALQATAKRGEPFKTDMAGNVVPLRGLSFRERNALVTRQMRGERLTPEESDQLFAHNAVMRRTLENNGATLRNGYRVDGFGNIRYFTLDHDNRINRLSDESVIERRFYRDAQSGQVRYLADGESLPAGVDARDTGIARELRFEGQLIARDFGVPNEYRSQSEAGGFRGGDAVDAIRRQVAVDAQRYPELARLIDPGSGQVNPLDWAVFQAAARRLGSSESPTSMVVASNGLMNTYQTARNNAVSLANGLRDAVVVNVLNPSTGRMLVDGLEAMRSEVFLQRQSVQGAIQVQMLEAIEFNRGVAADLRLNAPLQTMYIGHSQGTINGNLAIMRLKDPDLLAQVRLINIGTATAHLPRGLGGFDNIYDVNDQVSTVWTSGSQILDRNVGDPGADSGYPAPRLNLPPNYSEIRTDFATDGMLTGNSHSLYLYLMRPAVQQALGFKQTPRLAMPYTDYGR